MAYSNFFIKFINVPLLFWACVLGLLIGPIQPVHAQNETVLYSFCRGGSPCADGHEPRGLIKDAKGNLYGITWAGGAYNQGTVFEVTPAGAETVLYSFCPRGGTCTDGFWPVGGLIMSAKGNLYGTTAKGGTGADCPISGSCGTVFELSSPAKTGGKWTEAVLYNFGSQLNCADGCNAIAAGTAPLVMDATGNLYGTTGLGGAAGGCGNSSGCGTVFKLAAPTTKRKARTETVLYSFCTQNRCSDGSYPGGGLIMDAKGNLYGTTWEGGTCTAGPDGCGTVFKLSPPVTKGGKWTETVLYSFAPPDCEEQCDPALISMDATGNLYGATAGGGTCTVNATGCGTLFELSPPATRDSSWTETILYSFCSGGGSCRDGDGPNGVIMNPKGHFYGVTSAGGTCAVNPDGCGTLFELSPPSTAGGAWKETVLHSFCPGGGFCTDGQAPNSLLMDAKGDLYGATGAGGEYGFGAVFRFNLDSATPAANFPLSH